MRTIIIFFICLISTQFAKNKIKLEEIYSIGSDDEVLFVQLTDIKIYDDDIYLSDKNAFSLYKISLDGKIIKVTGNKGGGPGEFTTGPNRIGKLNNKIVVTDGHGNMMLHYFYKDLSFSHSKTFDVSFFLEAEHNKIVSYNGDFDSGNFLIEYNSNLKKEKPIKLSNISESIPENEIKFRFDQESNLIVYFVNRNLVEIYDRNSTLKHTLTIPGFRNSSEFSINNKVKKICEARMKPKMAERFYKLPKYSIIRFVVPDFNNNLYIQGASYSDELKKMVYVMSYKGELLGEFELNEDERIMAIDKNNNLYTFAEDRTVLKKYKIKIKN